MSCEVFVSATSDLAPARRVVSEALSALGHRARSQEIEATNAGELVDLLKKRLAPCEIVIQLIGTRYGAEPSRPLPGFDRCSYTQLEALIAEQMGKKIVYIATTESFPTDEFPAERDELVALQGAYCDSFRERNILLHEADSPDRLERLILRLRDELAEVRTTASKRHRTLLLVSGVTLTVTLAVLAWVVFVGGGENANPSWIEITLEQSGYSVSDLSADLIDVSAVPYRYGGAGQGMLIVKATGAAAPVSSVLQARIGTGAWRQVFSDTAGDTYAILPAEDLARGGALEIQFSDQYGDPPRPIGPYTYDISPAAEIRAWQEERLQNSPDWVRVEKGRIRVDGDFIADCDELLIAARWGEDSSFSLGRLEIAAGRPGELVDTATSDSRESPFDAARELERALKQVESDASTLFVTLELVNGEFSPLIRLPWNAPGGAGSGARDFDRAWETLSEDWTSDCVSEDAFLSLAPLSRAHKSLRALRFGESPESMREVPFIEQREANGRADSNFVTANQYGAIPVMPGTSHVYVQLVLVDGSETEIRRIEFEPGKQTMCALPATDSSGQAPALFAAYEAEGRFPFFLLDVPSGTTRVLASFGGSDFKVVGRSGRFWGRGGFSVSSWKAEDEIQFICQLEGGEELGSFSYALSPVRELIPRAYLAEIQPHRREMLRATRYDFDFDPESPPTAGSPEHRQWRQHRDTIMRAVGWRTEDLYSTPAVVVRRGRWGSRLAWTAIREIRFGPGPDQLETTVIIETDVLRLLKQSNGNPSTWTSVLEGSFDAVFAQLVLVDGTELSPFLVAGSEH